MSLGGSREPEFEPDETDLRILEILQADAKTSLAQIGGQIGMSAPSVLDRVKRLEAEGLIRGYHAVLDSRMLGLDVTAFVGVSGFYQKMIGSIFDVLAGIPDVLECHHVTGEHTLMIKVKTESTASLERVISQLRTIPGVERTNTMVVLSTQQERVDLPLPEKHRKTSADGKVSKKRGAKASSEHR